MLTSAERYQLAIFIMAAKREQDAILEASQKDSRVSGTLIHAYREVLKLI